MLDQPKPSTETHIERIGHSVKHEEILCHTIGSGPHSVLIVAGIHGNEVGTVKFAHRLTPWILSEPALLSYFRFLIIPCLNPDGYNSARITPDYLHGGRIGRLNANSVDLNRNFPTPSWVRDATWNHGLNYQEITAVFAGESPASEPEVQALLSVIAKQKPHLIISLHNAGSDVIANPDLFSQNLGHAFAAASGYRWTKNVSWRELKQTGTAAEWCEIANIPYVEIEGNSRWSSDWARQKRGIEELLKTFKETQRG
ncbi:MAG: hypothetical protein RIQ56_159 [Candidatus Parcubacteria bacterium]|jgi:predicted deacylase